MKIALLGIVVIFLMPVHSLASDVRDNFNECIAEHVVGVEYAFESISEGAEFIKGLCYTEIKSRVDTQVEEFSRKSNQPVRPSYREEVEGAVTHTIMELLYMRRLALRD